MGLLVVVAVFLAYNANAGLPFVPTYELEADIPNGAQLVPGNEIREGGHRIGTVTKITPQVRKDRTTGAELLLKLDATAGPVPPGSTIKVRPRSALGLKYVELERGSAKDTLDEGATVTAGEEALAPELQQFFNLFDARTRENVTENITELGNGFAGRGTDVNRALNSLPRFLRAVPPLMLVLKDPQTHLVRFFSELEDAARITAPLARTGADGFRAGADTFEALSRDPRALRQTIAESPPTLEVGTRALRKTRPFLRSLASVSDDLRLASAELRRSAPSITVALRSGIAPLRQTPALNRRLTGTFDALTSLARSPGSDTGVAGPAGDDGHAAAPDALPRPVRDRLQLLELLLHLPGRPLQRPGPDRPGPAHPGQDPERLGQLRPRQLRPGPPDSDAARAALRLGDRRRRRRGLRIGPARLQLQQGTVSNFLSMPGWALRSTSPTQNPGGTGHVLPQLIVSGSQTLTSPTRSPDNRGNTYVGPDALNFDGYRQGFAIQPSFDCKTKGGVHKLPASSTPAASSSATSPSRIRRGTSRAC